MTKSIKEIGRKAEDLIEQGKEADQNISNCQSRVMAASSNVAAARRQLAAASMTDENGNPVGDVGAAQARLNMAQNQLAASERALETARSESENIRRQKQSQVSEISSHNQTSKNNLEKIRRLKSLAFGKNVNALEQGMVDRINEAEDSRVKLLESMGIDVNPDYVEAEDAGPSMQFRGANVRSVDISGQPQSHKGGRNAGSGTSEGMNSNGGISTPVGGGLNSDKQVNSDSRTAFGKLFGIDQHQSEGNRSKVFGSFTLEKDPMNDERYFVRMENYEKFKDFWESADKYTTTPCNKQININARSIEGIYLNENEANDEHLFWNRGQEHPVDSKEYFMVAASHIPEVQARLATGETLDSIKNDPKLKDCCDLYFENPISVNEADDYYVFSNAGRHRVMAAQAACEQGYEIPVNVIGKIELKNSGKLSSNKFSPKFKSTALEANNTKKLVDFVNSVEGSDKRIINLYNSIGDIEALEKQGISFNITHGPDCMLERSCGSVGGDIRTTSFRLNIPLLSGENIIGQVQTTLHEDMHLIDQLLKKDVGDFYSPGFAASNAKLNDVVNKTPCSMSKEIGVVFSNHDNQVYKLIDSNKKKYESLVSDAKKQFAIDHDFSSYIEKVNNAKKTCDRELDYNARNIMSGGVGQLEDIYDALSGGALLDSGKISFGHGSNYYVNDEKKIDEIIANYGSLSVTRPDLISLFKKDKPELVSALDNIIDSMNERVIELGK